MPGIAIKAAMVTELQRQLNQELGAAHSYLALAAWCNAQNFKGFARYLSKQAVEERQHAQKFMQHLLDRGVLPVLTSLDAPPPDFSSLMEVARHAQGMEQANTAGINACYAAAVREQDYPAQVLLHWFISEQVEEEDWADEMVDRIQRANCAGGLSDLDRHIERYLTEEGANAAKCEES
ncbi:MAG: ferritin [Tepidisphaeraceae bacterium]|jgi:ferritin